MDKLHTGHDIRAHKANALIAIILSLLLLAFTGCSSASSTDADSPARFSDSGTAAEEMRDEAVPKAAPAITGTTVGGFIVAGGTQGTDYKLNGTTLEVLTSTPLTIQNVNQAAATNYGIQINAGVEATVTLAGVYISGASLPPLNVVTNSSDTSSGSKATSADDIIHKTSLHLILGDGSSNILIGSANQPGLRCGEGSVLVLDDSRLNIDSEGNPVVPVNGLIGADLTLQDGTSVKAGDPLTRMDSDNPGSLTCTGGTRAAGFGGAPYEKAGLITIEGGIITSSGTGTGSGSENAGAGIGGGINGGCTDLYINGGVITATGAYHAAGIGAGYGNQTYVNGGTPQADAIQYLKGSISGTVGGNIYINGGFIKSTGGAHGNAFGQGCVSSNTGKIIKVTGGTLLPTSPSGYDIGGSGGYAIITGGSVRCASAAKFQGIGNTAYNTPDVNTWEDIAKYGGALPEEDKVEMITIDLSSELEGNDKGQIIDSWQLSVAGLPYDYGAPSRFDAGKLYLWLPKTATAELVTVDLAYKKDDGTVQTVEPLFREPGAGSLLKRYIEFELDSSYNSQLVKPYDGLPLEAYDMELHPVTTDEAIPKTLNINSSCKFTYQRFDAPDGTPIGAAYDRSAPEAGDAGHIKFTVVSTQFSNETGFKENYWGHRAIGWGEITPVDSQVQNLDAMWVATQKPGSERHDSTMTLRVSADIKGAEGTAATCRYPQGSVQLYVDGKPVGEPIALTFDAAAEASGISTLSTLGTMSLMSGETDAAALSQTASGVNATIVSNGSGGSYTHFTYDFAPAETDYLVPDATSDGKHIVSLQYIPSKNYNESMSPDPEKDEDWVEVDIDPIDPNAAVEQGKVMPPKNLDTDGDGIPDAYDMDGDGQPDPVDPDPVADPNVEVKVEPREDDPNSNGHIIHGSIKTVYSEPTEDNPYPGRVELKIDTPSSGAIKVVTDDGETLDVIVVTDENGNPVRDEDGKITVYVDPKGAGHASFTVQQEANGAYTPTAFLFDVDVTADLKLTPAGTTAKSVRNLTHPNGPVLIGDTLEYTIEATNSVKGSAWQNVVVTDEIPAALIVDKSSIHIKNTTGNVEKDATEASGDPAVGEFALDGSNKLTVAIGDVYGVGTGYVVFNATVGDDAIVDGKVQDISNVASATGDKPADPDDPSSKPTPMPTDPSDPVIPDGGEKILPKDPADGDIVTTKTVENKTNPSSATTSVGDTLSYTIVSENTGDSSSCLFDVMITDPMPVGIEPVPGTFKLIDPQGNEIAVADDIYDATTRTIGVYVGNLYGKTKAVLTFDAKVATEAMGADTSNIAHTYGTLPSKAVPEIDPDNPDADVIVPEIGNKTPGSPATPPSGEDDGDDVSTYFGHSEPATPGTLTASDPKDGDVTLNKTAKNLTTDAGETRIGDTIEYTLTLTNHSTDAAFMDAIIRDTLPKGIDPLSGTIKMTLPNGTVIDVEDKVYNSSTRVMAVQAGHVYPGQTVTLTFNALVNTEAQSNDIGNKGEAFGKDPSEYDYNSPEPTPGAAVPDDFDYDSYGKSLVTDAVYPPGTFTPSADNPTGGVGDLPAGSSLDTSGIIRTLAKTGDIQPFVIGGIAIVLVLAALTAFIVTRRRKLNAMGC